MSSKAQTSRKGKKAWRKNVKLHEVENALEEAREEERMLGKRLKDADNQELWVIDKTGDEKGGYFPWFLTIKVKKEVRHKRLRIEEILEPTSKVPALVGRVKKSRESKELRRIEQKAKKLAPKKQKVDQEIKDVWQESESEPDDLPFVEKPKKIQRPTTMQAPPKTTTIAPAYSHEELNLLSGESYNPSKEAHEALMNLVVKKELAKTSSKAKELEEHGREIKSLDFRTDDPDDMLQTDESEDEDYQVQVEPTVQPGRKTKAQRNKERKMKAELTEKRRKEMEKKKKMDLERLADLIPKPSEPKKKKKASRLGPHKMEELIPDVALPSELPSNLRELEPEGNLFKDRIQAMQKRKLIEPRLPFVQRRKYKLKSYEKPSYRFFE